MKPETVQDIIVFLNFISWGIRFVGLLVFGLMSAWLTMRTYTLDTKSWQVQTAAVAVFIFLAGALVNSSNPGAAGAFALGAGAGIFLWGFSKEKG